MGLYKGTELIAGALPTPPGAMTYRGSCLQADLPTASQQKGDYWKLSDTEGTYKGQCAIWNGSSWDYSSANINIDSVLSSTSTNPVENKIITAALDNKVTKEDGKGLFSGSYTDLTNKPSLDFLPLAGGTMTGPILNSGTFEIKANSTTNARLNLCGGNDYKDGAYLEVYGKTHTAYPGYFILGAPTGSTTPHTLIGKPNGELTWDGYKIVVDDYEDITSKYFKNSKLTGYVKATRTGNIITVAVNGGTFTGSPLFTVDDKYRPKGRVTVCPSAFNLSSNKPGFVQIQGDTGNAMIYGEDVAIGVGNWFWSCTYIMQGE